MLYRDPRGKKIFDKSKQTETNATYNIVSKDQNADTELIQLQNKVREQEESIHIKDRKISELEKMLMNIEVWSILSEGLIAVTLTVAFEQWGCAYFTYNLLLELSNKSLPRCVYQ